MAVKEAKYICRTIFSKKKNVERTTNEKHGKNKICVRIFCKDQYDKESFLSKKKRHWLNLFPKGAS